MERYKFPKNFLWGSASSALQSEGGRADRGEVTWDVFYKKDPIRFFNEVGPDVTSDFYNRYKEDIEIMSSIGLNSFRTSISWARLFPEKNKLNDKAVDFYNNIIDEQIKNKIEPFLCLYHSDTPMRLQRIGGWEAKETVYEYRDFAKKCFELFGDRVKYWFTFNEPVMVVEGGYLDDRHYPGLVDFNKATKVAHNIILAHSLAVDEYKKLNMGGEIGIILNLSPVYSRSENPYDIEARMICDNLYNRSFLDTTIKGKYPDFLCSFLKRNHLLPEVTIDELDIIAKNKIDILGVNYYYPKRVKAKENIPNMNAPIKPTFFYDYYNDMKGKKMNKYRGWEIYERGIYDIAMDLYSNYGNIKWFVSENGMGVEDEERFKDENGVIQDDYRIKFIIDHLVYLHRAMEKGANCIGYHLWTFLDNWSWINAYKNRYGFVELDLNNNLERRVKKSGYWIKEVIEKSEFEDYMKRG
ncbi:glycoside hydrolase family 1 protein [Brachyspira pilosicoli]|uniref:glycoside hydrolase family 1 protein n=1 Tax=Brachyspira pilosicoli TaxID=52584 RepID=UPI0030078761